jgi:hypothetical protein
MRAISVALATLSPAVVAGCRPVVHGAGRTLRSGVTTALDMMTRPGGR